MKFRSRSGPITTSTAFLVVIGLMMAPVRAAESPDHVLIIHDSPTATVDAALGVFEQIGVKKEAAMPILNELSTGGQALAAQGPKAPLERAAAKFEEIGIRTTVKAKHAESEYAGSDVVEVRDASALEELMASSGGVLLKFYGSSCAHCTKMVPELKSAASALKGSCQVGAINLQAVTGGQEIAQRLGIRVLPTIRFVVGGNHLEYKGARTAAEMQQFVSRAKSGPAGAEAADEQPKTSAASTESAAASEPRSKLAQSKVQERQQAAAA
jgi:thioredoxin-like negative regulator of GroEL|uniref:Thioredoxin domain-containing protein n=1 Tax=Haptolina ericina TaxID=156174 RepID=A0A7S3F0J6_9EUKA|mmetsp:Transcript_43475/g.98269  ORF Transcript_43475/g.98269 Transcript_43475/m.98269 type:complete len:269 (+) Transcript_43475:3-809(+)